MAIKAGGLFAITTNKPEIIAEPKQVVVDATSTVVRSVTNNWISAYQPDVGTDRFLLISPEGKTYACKFYNRETDKFLGASLIAMYALNEFFDRSIIPGTEG